jgi:hypothetical protein
VVFYLKEFNTRPHFVLRAVAFFYEAAFKGCRTYENSEKYIAGKPYN